MLCIDFTSEVLKFVRSRAVKAKQFLNIQLMSVTFCVLKFFRSSVWSALQPSNMLFIVSTFEVLKLLRSRVVKASLFSNMLFIDLTSEVLRFCSPSMAVRALRPWNHPAVEVGLKLANEASITALVVVVL